ncbi:Protein ILITYHIA [Camellia lanceoleosa]|uniref:Protein ILITYHIA n=1 Tax=Camellia lanceoleosa TaxID=1840588 RepID=A0ACC0HJT2_9ERIC|nr:Protein ILITYHIA [Camellia lanceoleosa]
MPVLMNTLITSLASSSSERRQVAGRSLGELVRKLGERVLPLIIPILSRGLKDPNASRRQEVQNLAKKAVEIVVLVIDEEGIEPLISELLKGVGDHQASIRRSSSYLLGYFFKNSKLYLVDEAPNVITTLIVLLSDLDSAIVAVAWEALSRVVGLVLKEVLPSYIKLVRDAVSTSRDKERRKRKGGPVLIPGLCLPKALQPLLPIFLHGLISGSAELREQAAQGLGELIEVTSE